MSQMYIIWYIYIYIDINIEFEQMTLFVFTYNRRIVYSIEQMDGTDAHA